VIELALMTGNGGFDGWIVDMDVISIISAVYVEAC
jgi:hypothetical protein